MNTKNKRTYWACVCEVAPEESCRILGGANGAFVAVAGKAADGQLFADSVRNFLHGLGLILINIDDVDSSEEIPLTLSPDIIQGVKDLGDNDGVVLGGFHCFHDNG